MLTLLWLVAVVIGLVALAYVNAAGWLWILGIGAALIAALAVARAAGAADRRSRGAAVRCWRFR